MKRLAEVDMSPQVDQIVCHLANPVWCNRHLHDLVTDKSSSLS